MEKILTIITCLLTVNLSAQKIDFKNLKIDTAIQVLNVGTFHMGYSSDAHTVDFDEHNKNNIREIHEVAKRIAEFKPTIIIVERTPSYNQKLQLSYKEYLKNPKMKFKNPSEIELLAFEVGRLSNTIKIYAIDHHLGYNYMIGNDIHNSKDEKIVNWYYQQADSLDKVFESTSPLVRDRLLITNQPFYLDFLLNINSDILTHIATAGGHEGADEATKYYQRNLRMYSNLNQINMTSQDRIFILMGASHTAFFRQWLARSPKYELINTLDYL